METEKISHAEKIAMAITAREELHLLGFISESENDAIHARIRKYQDRYRVNGSEIVKYLNLQEDEN